MDPTVLRQELLELLLLIQHLNPLQVKDLCNFLQVEPSDGWSVLLAQYLQKCSKEQIEALVALSAKQTDMDQEPLRKSLDPLATECQLNPLVTEDLFNLTLEIYYLQNLLQNLSILQLMKLFEVIPSGPLSQQKQLVQQIQTLFGQLQPDTVMNLHRQLEQATPGTEQNTLAELLNLPLEHFQLYQPLLLLFQLDLEELLKLQQVLPQFQLIQIKLLLQLLQLQPFDVLQFRDMLFPSENSFADIPQDLEPTILTQNTTPVMQDQQPQPPAPPEKKYTLQIVEQPPEKSVYKRNLKPNPMVTVQGDNKLLPNLYVAVTLVRCDTFQEEAKYLTGNRPERVTSGRVVTFRKLKITTTSHQQQETLFCLRFELRKYMNETEFEVIDSNHSNPICVLSHSTQMKPVPTVAPVITEVIPSCGPPSGGTRVAILGNNFVESPAARIRFDQTDVMPIFHGPGTLICHTPQHQPGAVTVRVCNSNKKWSDTASTFTYDASIDSFRDPMQDAIIARQPNYDSNIGEASWSGNFETVRRLQENGANVNTVDNRGYTALHYACAIGDSDITSFLLDRGIDVNVQDKSGYTSLFWAAAFGHEEIVQLLIDHGANLNISSYNGVSPMHATAFNGDSAIASLLLEHGASPNTVMLEGQSPLHIACATGSTQLVEDLLRCGSFVNSTDVEGDTPLHWAVREGQVNIVKSLVSAGACLDVLNDDEETPLHLAMELGDRAVVDVLLLNNAVVVSRDVNGATPLHYSASIGSQYVQTLTKLGAFVNEKDTNGETPLHYAVRHANNGLVGSGLLLELVKEGADINLKNNDGLSPQDIAVAMTKSLLQGLQNSQKIQYEHQEKISYGVPKNMFSDSFKFVQEINGKQELDYLSVGRPTKRVSIFA